MSRLAILLACVAAFVIPASAQVAAPNQTNYLWTGLYNETSQALVAGFGALNQYCTAQAGGTYVSFFCTSTQIQQYTCADSNCTNCTVVNRANPEYVGAQNVNTTGGATQSFNLTNVCSTDRDLFSRQYTNPNTDIALAIYDRVSDCSGNPSYYLSAPVGSCVAISQYQSPFQITSSGVTVYTAEDTTCSNANASQIIVPLTGYSATEGCTSSSSPPTSTFRLGFQVATTAVAPTTAVAATTVNGGVATAAAGTAAATAAAGSTGGQSTTGIPTSTGAQTTTAAAGSTTGVQSTTYNGIVTTGVQTTGVQTTGIQTTGIQTTAIQTTGRATTSSASTVSVMSAFAVVAVVIAALF